MDGIEEIDNPKERGVRVVVEKKHLEIVCEKGRDGVIFAISEDLEPTASREIPRKEVIIIIRKLLDILQES